MRLEREPAGLSNGRLRWLLDFEASCLQCVGSCLCWGGHQGDAGLLRGAGLDFEMVANNRAMLQTVVDGGDQL